MDSSNGGPISITHTGTQDNYQEMFGYMIIKDMMNGEDDARGMDVQFIFKESTTSKLMVEIRLTNDVSDGQYDVEVQVYDYNSSTWGTSDTTSYENFIEIIFFRIDLYCTTTGVDTLACSVNVSPFPMFPTGCLSAWHINQNADLDIDYVRIQPYIYNIEPGFSVYISPLFIEEEQKGVGLTPDTVRFPYDLTEYGTFYYYGDDRNNGRFHIGPIQSLPFSIIDRQMQGYLEFEVGLSTDDPDPDGKLFAKVKYIVTTVASIITDITTTISTIITSPQTWVRKLIYEAFKNIVTDDPGQLEYFTDIFLWLGLKLGNWINTNVSLSKIFDFDGE